MALRRRWRWVLAALVLLPTAAWWLRSMQVQAELAEIRAIIGTPTAAPGYRIVDSNQTEKRLAKLGAEPAWTWHPETLRLLPLQQAAMQATAAGWIQRGPRERDALFGARRPPREHEERFIDAVAAGAAHARDPRPWLRGLEIIGRFHASNDRGARYAELRAYRLGKLSVALDDMLCPDLGEDAQITAYTLSELANELVRCASGGRPEDVVNDGSIIIRSSRVTQTSYTWWQRWLRPWDVDRARWRQSLLERAQAVRASQDAIAGRTPHWPTTTTRIADGYCFTSDHDTITGRLIYRLAEDARDRAWTIAQAWARRSTAPEDVDATTQDWLRPGGFRPELRYLRTAPTRYTLTIDWTTARAGLPPGIENLPAWQLELDLFSGTAVVVEGASP